MAGWKLRSPLLFISVAHIFSPGERVLVLSCQIKKRKSMQSANVTGCVTAILFSLCSQFCGASRSLMRETLQVYVLTGIPWCHKSQDLSCFGFQTQRLTAQRNFLLSLQKKYFIKLMALYYFWRKFLWTENNSPRLHQRPAFEKETTSPKGNTKTLHCSYS